jgi:hypothetical protein
MDEKDAEHWKAWIKMMAERKAGVYEFFKKHKALIGEKSTSHESMASMILLLISDAKKYNIKIEFDVRPEYKFGRYNIKYVIIACPKDEIGAELSFLNVNYNPEHPETLFKALSLYYLYSNVNGWYNSNDLKIKEKINKLIKSVYLFDETKEENIKLRLENEQLKKENLILQNKVPKEINPQIRYSIKRQKCYLMIDDATGLVKIGKSINPENRERTLQSEKPTIKMIHYFDNDIERELHNKFRDKRVRGEWFRLDMNEVSEIIKAKKSSR